MIPVILIHSGYQDYLNYSINKALEKNVVYLIGDVEPTIQNPNFKFFNMADFIDDDFTMFSQLYEHLSTNPYKFELFCFLRWFVLKRFMQKQNLDVCFYIDSDVMLYVDVNTEWTKFSQFDFTLCHRSAATSSFFTINGIINFCNFLLNTYRQKNSYQFKKIESHYRVRQEFGLPGGVCDMTLLEYFHYGYDVGGGPGKIGEMMIIINDSTYDHNINSPDQYFEFDGVKKVQMIDGVPHVFSRKLNKLIKFNCLHFNSGAKNLIKNYI